MAATLRAFWYVLRLRFSSVRSVGADAAREQIGRVVVGFGLAVMLRVAAAHDDAARRARAPALAIQLGCRIDALDRIALRHEARVAVAIGAAAQTARWSCAARNPAGSTRSKPRWT